MIAGTLAVLTETADETLTSKSNGFTTLDVRETLTYLDEATVQRGRACARVESQQEEIFVDGTEIETEMVGAQSEAYTEWVADVTDAGFIVTERTAGEEPMFPFDLFEVACQTEVARAHIDTGGWAQAQQRDGNNPDIWFSGSKTVVDDDTAPDDVDMGYGRDANQSGGNIGVGFRTAWNGRRVKGIMYASGYIAVYSEWVGETAFAQFVREEVLPHAEAPETAQSILDGDDDAE